MDDDGDSCFVDVAALRSPKRRRRAEESFWQPAGPATVDETFKWPEQFIHRFGMEQADGLAELVRKFCEGLTITTDYSGTGAAEFAVLEILAALQRRGHSLDKRSVRVASASDIKRVCQQIVVESHPEAEPGCVFGDLLQRLPEQLLQDITRRQLHYNKLAARVAMSANDISQQQMDAFGSEFFQEVVTVLIEATLPEETPSCYCFKHDNNCRWLPPPRRHSGEVYGNISGVSCIPWSAFGSKDGWLSESSLPFFAWAFSMRHGNFDFIVIENTPQFDECVAKSMFSDIYTIDAIIFCPSEVGFPVSRPRKYVVMLRRAALRWARPFNRHEFLATFGRDLRMHAADYYRAEERVVTAHKDS